MSDTKLDFAQDKMPKSVALLGYGGLIPFIGLAVGSAALPGTARELAAHGLLFYAAIILSFLGGLHWGRVAASDATNGIMDDNVGTTGWLIWSVTPSLWAWGVIWLLSSLATQAILLAIGLFVCWQVDRYAMSRGIFASWMQKLRRNLTVMAIMSLLSLVVF